MNTSPTNPSPSGSLGTVFFDGDCAFCRASLRRFGGPFRRAGFEFVPYQQALADGTMTLPAAEFEREMKLRRADGRWFGGVGAWIEMCREVTWLKPLGWLGELPGIHHLLAWGYRRIAANRYCLAGRCGTQRENPS